MASFRCLYGAEGSGPVCSVLRLGGLTLVLDCGWDDAQSASLLEPVLEVLEGADAVLVSHPDLSHLGALPALAAASPSLPPIYATSAARRLGQMVLYDQCVGRVAGEGAEAYTLDDVDSAFEDVVGVKYHQTMSVSRRGSSSPTLCADDPDAVTVTALAAGHLLGGALWVVQHRDESVIYCAGFNQRKERHLAGAALAALPPRPALLVAAGVDPAAAPGQQAERELLECAVRTLRGDGDVLIPVDAAGRVLELLLLLDAHWSERALPYPLVFLGPVARSTLEVVRSQLEWTGEALTRGFGCTRDNPFALRAVRLCSAPAQLEALPAGPKLVLATEASLEGGPARDLLGSWLGRASNAVLFPAPPRGSGTGAQTLAQRLLAAAPGEALDVTFSRRVPLEGEELARAVAEAREEREERAAAEPPEPAAARAEPSAARKSLDAAAPPSAARGGRKGDVGAGGEKKLDARLPAAPSPGSADASLNASSVRALLEALEDRPCVVDGFVPGPGVGLRFPDEAEALEREFDPYGALEPAPLLQAGRGFGVGEDRERGGGLGKPFASGIQPEAPPSPSPALDEEEDPARYTRVETATRTLFLAAKVQAFDCRGLADARSTETLLGRISARTAVLLGAPAACDALERGLRRACGPAGCEVIRPGLGAADAPLLPGFRLRVDPSLAASVRPRQLGETHLGWVEGRVGSGESGAGALMPLDRKRGDAAEAGDAVGGVLVGDAKLSELKAALNAQGLAADFHQGVLFVGGGIVVRRKEQGGGLEVDGGLGETWDMVHRLIYSQYQMC